MQQISLAKLMIYLILPTTFVPAYESLAHPALPQTSNKNQYLPGTGFKAMRIFKSTFLFKESPSLQDKIQFQSCCDQGLHGARGPIIFCRPLGLQTQPPPGSLLQLCTQAYYTTTPAFVFWPRDKKNTVDWDATAGKEISDLLRKSEVHFFMVNSSRFYPLPRYSKIGD